MSERCEKKNKIFANKWNLFKPTLFQTHNHAAGCMKYKKT